MDLCLFVDYAKTAESYKIDVVCLSSKHSYAAILSKGAGYFTLLSVSSVTGLEQAGLGLPTAPQYSVYKSV